MAPNYAPAHFQLAIALLRKGDQAQSEQEFQKAAELDPKLKRP
jgi:Flp pilus assembly protein TadD